MRGVRISGIDLDSDGCVVVEKLADIFEDGEVVGNSYLASSLRKSVAERGPTPLDTVIRRFNNGYFGAAWMYKGRVYIKEDGEAPAGARVQEGPRGGRYYDTEAGRGRPLNPPPEGYMPQVGERVRIRWPGDDYNGKLGRVTEISEEEGLRPGEKSTLVARVEGIGWLGTFVTLDEGKLLPAPYTAKEKREMKAKDIMMQEFGKTDLFTVYTDIITGLEYDVYSTEAGPNLWVKREPKEEKKRYEVTKESAVSLGGFMKALPEMSTQALTHMKEHVEDIVFSPVPNPNDRATSKRIGAKFTSSASLDMKLRTMRIWPAVKGAVPERLAKTLTHETGHAVDDMRTRLGAAYIRRLRKFWDEAEARGIERPAGTRHQEAVEAEHGVPPDPTKWLNDYGRWKDFDLGTRFPSHVRYWRALSEEVSWNGLSAAERSTVQEAVKGMEAVTKYAGTNEHEYYAEAYTFYQQGRLPKGHMMYNHFKNLERTRQWVQS